MIVKAVTTIILFAVVGSEDDLPAMSYTGEQQIEERWFGPTLCASEGAWDRILSAKHFTVIEGNVG